MDFKFYSVIIPVYRGEKSLEQLFQELKHFFEANQIGFEVIFVDDNSKDKSWDKITQLKSNFPLLVKAIRLAQNYGQHQATLCGFGYAKGNFIITMDEDLQQKPTDIALLIQKQKENNWDLVYGKYPKRQHSFFRNLTSRLMKLLLRIIVPALHPDYTSFRLIHIEMIKKLSTVKMNYVFFDTYLAKITDRVSSVLVSHSKSKAGKSAWSLKKLFKHAFFILFAFFYKKKQEKPIRIAFELL